MNTLISVLCLAGLLLPTALGVGITVLLRRAIGGWAHLVGWILPVILLIGLYAAIDLWTRATPCEPPGTLRCGEPAGYALILFVAILALTVVANTIAQAAMFLIWRMRQARSLSE